MKIFAVISLLLHTFLPAANSKNVYEVSLRDLSARVVKNQLDDLKTVLEEDGVMAVTGLSQD